MSCTKTYIAEQDNCSSINLTTFRGTCSVLFVVLLEGCQQLGGSLEKCTGVNRGVNILIYTERLRVDAGLRDN